MWHDGIMAHEITIDERGRTSLARVRKQTFDRYTAQEEPDGTLILRPATISPRTCPDHPYLTMQVALNGQFLCAGADGACRYGAQARSEGRHPWYEVPD